MQSRERFLKFIKKLKATKLRLDLMGDFMLIPRPKSKGLSYDVP